MIKIDTVIKNSEHFNNIAKEVYSLLGLKGEAVVEVDIVEMDEIKDINFRERGIDKATDVLSFPALSEITEFCKDNYPFEYDYNRDAVMLGNIIICDEIASEQAKEYGHPYERELCYLFTHGLLHLLGYDHIEEADKKVMREKEEKVLNKLNIKR